MRKTIIALALILFSGLAFAQVTADTSTGWNGQKIVRFVNHNTVPVNCEYRDSVRSYSFTVPARSRSAWISPVGFYRWNCYPFSPF